MQMNTYEIQTSQLFSFSLHHTPHSSLKATEVSAECGTSHK